MLNFFIKLLKKLFKVLFNPKQLLKSPKLFYQWEHPLKDFDFKISCGYGERVHPITGKPHHHNGVDYNTPTGTPIYAIVEPYKYEVKYGDKEGHYVKLWYKDILGNEYWIYYMHLEKGLVLEASTIKRGDLIGFTGSSGGSTGPHLHFAIKRKRLDDMIYYFIEPTKFFKK